MYVDGFNFYYGLYKPVRADPKKPRTRLPPARPGLKWLDLRAMGNTILSQLGIAGTLGMVVYCTAKVRPSGNDRSQQLRQELYLRALGTLPNLHVVLGLHVERAKDVVLLDAQGKPRLPPVPASIREEKGSDVNLAAYMIRDAAFDQFDTALVFTNDSDLASAVSIVRQDFAKDVVIVSPQFRENDVVDRLRKVASRAVLMETSWLEGCCLPDEIVDAGGRRITKPVAWNP